MNRKNVGENFSLQKGPWKTTFKHCKVLIKNAVDCSVQLIWKPSS